MKNFAPLTLRFGPPTLNAPMPALVSGKISIARNALELQSNVERKTPGPNMSKGSMLRRWNPLIFIPFGIIRVQ